MSNFTTTFSAKAEDTRSTTAAVTEAVMEASFRVFGADTRKGLTPEVEGALKVLEAHSGSSPRRAAYTQKIRAGAAGGAAPRVAATSKLGKFGM